jgi:hypothetical protein
LNYTKIRFDISLNKCGNWYRAYSPELKIQAFGKSKLETYLNMRDKIKLVVTERRESWLKLLALIVKGTYIKIMGILPH